MAQLLCDTNFLIKIANEPIPELREFIDVSNLELTTIPQVVRELTGLSRKKGVISRKASAALRLIGTKIRLDGKQSININADADTSLFEYAKMLNEGSFAATLDGKLLSRFQSNQLSYLTLRHDKPFFKSFYESNVFIRKKAKNL